MAKPKVVPLILESYLTAIRNSVGAKTYRNFYAKIDGRKEEILNNGELSCAWFASSVLVMFGLAKRTHTTVKATVDDLKQSGWRRIKSPEIGSVLVWEATDYDGKGSHVHIGFYLGGKRAISNSKKLGCPALHHSGPSAKRKEEPKERWKPFIGTRNSMADILVHASGKLFFKDKEYRCAIGRNGTLKDKKEGDGATPEGCFQIRRVFYRGDRVSKPKVALPCLSLSEKDAWCDDQKSPDYNTLVKLPYVGSYEKLWRDDNLYDLVAVIGYNDDPPIPGKGSAIFLHVARENYSPTNGCIALAYGDLIKILEELSPDSKICIQE